MSPSFGQVAVVSSHVAHVQTIEFAYSFAPNTLIAYGSLPFDLTGKETISIDGSPAIKPYLAGILPMEEGKKTLLILRLSPESHIDDFPTVTISVKDRVLHWKYNRVVVDAPSAFVSFLQTLNQASLAKLLLLFIRFSTIDQTVASQPNFIQFCLEMRARLSPVSLQQPASYWLQPNLLYMETYLPVQEYPQGRLLTTSAQGIQAGVCKIIPLAIDAGSEAGKYGILCHFPNDEALSFVQTAQFSVITKDRIIPITAPDRAPDINVGGLITHLMQMTEYHRLSLRDFLIRESLELTSSKESESLRALITTLQTYLLPTHTSICEKSLPFGINVEHAFSLPGKGYFLSGWLHDPLSLIESLHITTDLGFSISLIGRMHFYPRPDVTDLYGGSAFPVRNAECGFIALLEYPEELLKKLPSWASPVSMRLTIQLKSGMRYTVAPRAEIFNASQALETILQNIAPFVPQDHKAAIFIREAASDFQRLSSLGIVIARREKFGKAVDKPEASVVIPLYRSLDYIACQLAHFANDAFMRKTEVIYVLDSPEQETLVVDKLRSLSQLYRFPVTLLVLSRNGGYATATNLGASEGKSKYLLLLNSDVVPTRDGWLQRMLDMYRRQPNIGALAPKLLYEDDSIQHAGMYFSPSTQGSFFENLHYYKGYPASHPEACESREVPAVTAACLLVEKEKFEATGKLSTDFVIGDFEDSDLCLRMYEHGYRHHYLASEEMYHFERQSMSTLTTSHRARYWINATIHHERWSDLIPQVMKTYA
jgi:GT2 family glycosyltransferase